MGREFTEDKEAAQHTTLSELQKLLTGNPEIFGDQLQSIRETVENAQAEVQQSGKLSQRMAERLDDLYRPFKPEFLK